MLPMQMISGSSEETAPIRLVGSASLQLRELSFGMVTDAAKTFGGALEGWSQ